MPRTTLRPAAFVLTVAVSLGGALAAAAAQGVPRDETSKGYAFVEVVLPERAPFVGEPFVVRLRAGVDIDVLEANLVQPFRQPLDVPVQLDHPWFEGAPTRPAPLGAARAAGATGDPARTEEPGDAAGLTLARVALGAELARGARHAERGADGRRFTVLEFERTFVADTAGTMPVPEARLAFAYAVEFRDDLVSGRVPLDRHDAFVRGAEQALVVRALPEAGRPFAFTGAVGDYALTTALSGGLGGAPLVLSVAITAADVLGPFGAPRLDRFQGFEVLAVRDTSEGRTRTFEVELARGPGTPLRLAPVEFAAFDPARERYVELPGGVHIVPQAARTPGATTGAPATSSTPAPSPGTRSVPVGGGAAIPLGVLAAVAVLALAALVVLGRSTRG